MDTTRLTSRRVEICGVVTEWRKEYEGSVQYFEPFLIVWRIDLLLFSFSKTLKIYYDSQCIHKIKFILIP